MIGRRRLGWMLAWAASLCVVAPVQAAEPFRLTIVSFNVLVDFSRPKGFPAWKDRRDLCAGVLRDSRADLIGLQEPSPGQLKFFTDQLPEFDVHYFHEQTKQYTDAALLYRRDTFELLEHGHWWLSPTPEKSSTGFGNALPRLVVWARLKHRASQTTLTAFNTHFDNTQPSQQKMAELCQRQFQPFLQQGTPLFFFGDFNTHQDRGDYPRLTADGWQDAYRACPQASADGKDDNVPTCGDRRIDHIFYHGAGVSADDWQRLESPDPGRKISDHWPIVARFTVTP